MALVMRIKFPPTYPLIYKTLRVDQSLTANQAVEYIGEQLNCPVQGNIGLYIPAESLWLDPEKPLSEYPSLQDAVPLHLLLSTARLPATPLTFLKEEVEYKDRNAVEEKKPARADKDAGGGCCVIS